MRNELSVFGGGQGAVGAGDGDFKIRRAGISAGVGDRADRPFLLRLTHVIRQANRDITLRPVGLHLGSFLSGNRATAAAAKSASPCPASTDRHAFDSEFQRRAGADGSDPIRTLFDVVASFGPTVF